MSDPDGGVGDGFDQGQQVRGAGRLLHTVWIGVHVYVSGKGGGVLDSAPFKDTRAYG